MAIVDPDDQSREQIKNMLLGMDLVWLEAEASRYDFFSDIVEQAQPEIGLISLDSDPEKALHLVTSMTRTNPQCAILVVSSSLEGDLVLRAMRAGAKEFLTHPLQLQDLLSALERIGNQRFKVGETRPRGNTVIAVTGANGGAGCTSVAVNLGCAYAADQKNSVVLVDLDLCMGDADVLLDTIPDYTLVDVAQNISRLDFSLLKRSLTRHSSGLFLLPRPVQMEDTKVLVPEDLGRIVGLLKASFTHVILDLSKGYTPLDVTGLAVADHVLLVTQLDLPSLRNVVRLMMAFAEMEGVLDKVKVIVNRVGLEAGHISMRKAQDSIGKEIYFKIPNDYKATVEARNNGIPLVEQAPRAKITQAIVQLSRLLSGIEQEQPAAAGASKGSISRLFNFWGSSNPPVDKHAT
jgi:pilus assembly protein CpaE